jgi:hypothetical protein
MMPFQTLIPNGQEKLRLFLKTESRRWKGAAAFIVPSEMSSLRANNDIGRSCSLGYRAIPRWDDLLLRVNLQSDVRLKLKNSLYQRSNSATTDIE